MAATGAARGATSNLGGTTVTSRRSICTICGGVAAAAARSATAGTDKASTAASMTATAASLRRRWFGLRDIRPVVQREVRHIAEQVHLRHCFAQKRLARGGPMVRVSKNACGQDAQNGSQGVSVIIRYHGQDNG